MSIDRWKYNGCITINGYMSIDKWMYNNCKWIHNLFYISLRLEDGTAMPTECAIKIFKTTLNEFFRRDKYIKDDYRFKSRFNKQNPRKIVHMWAEKEMHNLKRY